MRTGVAADQVTAPAKIADLRGRQEAVLADPVRRYEEMAAPPSRFQEIGDAIVRARAAVIEGQENRESGSVLKFVNGDAARNC
jgi:hypothetical protein